MLERIITVLSKYTDIDPERITEKTNLRNDLALDSLQLVTIACALEEEFDVEIPDRDAMNIQTVGDALRFIEEAQ